MSDAPNLVPISRLPELVPSTTMNFWYQRSRLGLIPGQVSCGRFIVVDLDDFFKALKDGRIGELNQTV